MPAREAIQENTYHWGMDGTIANLGRGIYFRSIRKTLEWVPFVHSLEIHISKSQLETVCKCENCGFFFLKSILTNSFALFILRNG